MPKEPQPTEHNTHTHKVVMMPQCKRMQKETPPTLYSQFFFFFLKYCLDSDAKNHNKKNIGKCQDVELFSLRGPHHKSPRGRRTRSTCSVKGGRILVVENPVTQAPGERNSREISILQKATEGRF